MSEIAAVSATCNCVLTYMLLRNTIGLEGPSIAAELASVPDHPVMLRLTLRYRNPTSKPWVLESILIGDQPLRITHAQGVQPPGPDTANIIDDATAERTARRTSWPANDILLPRNSTNSPHWPVNYYLLRDSGPMSGVLIKFLLSSLEEFPRQKQINILFDLPEVKAANADLRKRLGWNASQPIRRAR